MNRLLFLLTTALASLPLSAQFPSQYANPFIGTGGHGHTFPGATAPFGMVQLSPDTRVDGSWDGCSGYHYSDSFIYGFSHTHLSGTGVSDYGDILLQPMAGKPQFEPATYGSKFSHANEKATPGYYSVLLSDDNILAELTTTTRVGFHRYTFPKAGLYSVVLDLKHRDRLTGYNITSVSKTRIEGYRRSDAWAKDQYVHFVIEFSQPVLKTTMHESKSKAGFMFLIKNKPLLVKVALSFCNTEGAAENLAAEIPGWDFDSTRINTTDIWNAELSKITAQSRDSAELVKFYTALYHCMIHPNVASDVNGHYRGMDNQIHTVTGYTHYSVFSLWDTYRALHPLLTLIDRRRTLDFIQTFLAMYRDGGRLPVWELASNETNCMIGYHAVSVICDAWAKGIRGFDSTLALEAMMAISNENQFGKHDYIKHGFISSQNEPESVSKTLEYAYDDWCISHFAGMIGRSSVAAEYLKRSRNWYNLYDPETGFMRARYNGNWLNPFDPKEVNNHYTEANSWQYSFYVPQDIHGFMEAMGGYEKLGSRLDQLFAEKSGTTGREQADITGLIGQYAHGNEPSHHIAWLYNYIYQPERTQNLIHSICTEFYTTQPDGLIGNEDCGQMSAWYVMAALGMYQVTPGFPWFTLATPALDKAIVLLENNQTIEIGTSGRQAGNFFTTPVVDDEKAMFVSYEQLYGGSKIQYNLYPKPQPDAQDYLLPPLPRNPINKPAPPLIAVPRSFRNSTKVSLQSVENRGRLFYYLDDDSLGMKYYTGPFEVNSNHSIHAFTVVDEGVETIKSPVSSANCYKMRNDWSVQTISTCNPQYTAGGPDALIDGLRGTTNWRAGDWQGYQSQDFEAIIDLGSMQLISEVSAGFLQDQRSWILMPTELIVSVSTDGEHFVDVGTVRNTIKPEQSDNTVQDLTCTIRNPRKSRYVKIKALNYGKLPAWHPGAPFNGEAFIFVDEIEVR